MEPELTGDELQRAIEDRVTVSDLFTQNDVATTVEEWTDILYSQVSEGYNGPILVNRNEVRAIVEGLKADNREEVLTTIVRNRLMTMVQVDLQELSKIYDAQTLIDYFTTTGGVYGAKLYLEDDDQSVLEVIWDVIKGDVWEIDGTKLSLEEVRSSISEKEIEEYKAGWTQETSDITRGSDNDREDLVTLISECSGSIYTTNIGTIVGGTATSGSKKVKDLHDPSARIDAQAPPSGGFNVQFQTGDDSHAAVIFTGADDDQAFVLGMLLQSFNEVTKLTSPNFERQ